ncbi:MAG: AAA family ATPase [Wenzhouxiangella sp.]|nr:AAA family ATPase [Wenzhouxiangella sp.]
MRVQAAMGNTTIPPEKLRWKPATGSIVETSTRKIHEPPGIIGQPGARQALTFSIRSRSRNHNAYVRGPDGSGRRTLVSRLFEELKPAPVRAQDFCYVHNFANPDRPRLIVLPGGQGRQFQQAMSRISLFVRDRLPEILKNDPIRSRREARKEAAEREIRLKIQPLEQKLRADGLALMRTQSGPTSRVSIYPLVMGKPVSPEEYRNLVTQKQAKEEDRVAALKKAESWQAEVNRFAHEVSQIWQQALQHIDQINATETARLLGDMTAPVGRRFKAPGMDVFLREIIDDIVEKRVGRDTSHLADPTLLYGVNVLTARSKTDAAPVIFANQPSVANLFGTIDPAWMSSGRAVTSFQGIRTGSLLEADGGYLVLDAADVLAEPGSWRMLMRALRTGLAEVVPPELGWPYSAQSLKPEPIPVDVRVILTGDGDVFDQLNRDDRDFSQLFKVVADFEETIERDQQGVRAYCRFLAKLVASDELKHFDLGAMESLAEHGARMSSEPGRLSSRFGDLADLAREANFLALDDGSEEVERRHVEQAFQRQRLRLRLPVEKLLRAIESKQTELQTRGRSNVHINTARAERCGTIDIASPAALSCALAPASNCLILGEDGQQSTRLQALLGRSLMLNRTPRMLARLTAVPSTLPATPDLDLARACLLFGALAEAPLRQDVAVLGGVDSLGQVKPVDALDERIEAWFELCNRSGLSGQQAVIVPRACADHLMLDPAVVKAAVNDMFRVYAVDHINQALELLTGIKAGSWKVEGFAADTLMGRARQRVLAFED